MGDEFQPGIHKPRSFGGSQDVESIAAKQIMLKWSFINLEDVINSKNIMVQYWSKEILPEGSQCLKVDGFQHMFRGIELQQQHDENAVVWQLLEFCLTHIVILNQHSNHNS